MIAFDFGSHRVLAQYRGATHNVPSPTKFMFVPEHRFILKGMLSGHTYIYGETGLGKSEVVRNFCSILAIPFYVVNMHGDTSHHALLGHSSLVSGSLVFNKGLALQAMECGGVLVLEELDQAKPDKLIVLNRIAAEGMYTVPETGETIKAHPDFRIVATANTFGSGDSSGFYSGAKSQNKAFLNRFSTIVEVGFPEIDLLRKIILFRYPKIDLKLVPLILQFTYNLREDLQETVNTVFGIRSLFNFIDKLCDPMFTPVEAAMYSFGNLTDSETRVLISDLIKVSFGE